MPRGGRKKRPRPTWLWADRNKRSAGASASGSAAAESSGTSASRETPPNEQGPMNVVLERMNNNDPAFPPCNAEIDEFACKARAQNVAPGTELLTPEETDETHKIVLDSSASEGTEPSSDPFKGFSSSFKGFSSLNVAPLEETSSKMSLEEAQQAPNPGVIPITSHVLDTSSGQPAAGLRVTLFKKNSNDDGWLVLNKGTTNSDGRLPGLTTPGSISPGIHMMRFETGDYFSNKNMETFYPHVEVVFNIKNLEHYHIPLLLSPYGYSTYRGS